MGIDTTASYPAQFQEKLSKVRELGGSVKYGGDNYTRDSEALAAGKTAGGKALVDALNEGGLGRASKLADIIDSIQKAIDAMEECIELSNLPIKQYPARCKRSIVTNVDGSVDG